MKKLSVQEIRKIGLELLKYFHEFCEENNLTYYLAYGTLLGAVRHKGFIPWDDDIDVAMPRKDYERFLKEFDNKNTNKDIEISSIYNHKNPYFFARLVNNRTITYRKNIAREYNSTGIWIDIYPLDNVSSNYKKALLLNKIICFFKFLLFHKICKYPFVKEGIINNVKIFLHKIVRGIVFFVPKKILNHGNIDKLSQKYNSDINSRYLAYVFTSYNKNFVLECCWFKEKILLEFEKYKFYAPKEYDKVLTNNYGDYMKLPPYKERKGRYSETFLKE